MKQLTLFNLKTKSAHGGKVNLGKRKVARPFDKNRMHHVVMKSNLAKGPMSFKNFNLKVQLETLIYEKARKYGIRIAEFCNVGNHFHILIRFQCRHLLKTFFRVTMGLVARIVAKAQKGKRFGRFWDGLVFTRVVSKGLDEARMRDYLHANHLQAETGSIARHYFLERRKTIWKLRLKKKSAVNDGRDENRFRLTAATSVMLWSR